LVQAANHFHLQPEEIGYQAIEKRHGFTKMRRKVVIEVDPAAPKRKSGSAVGPVGGPTAIPVAGSAAVPGRAVSVSVGSPGVPVVNSAAVPVGAPRAEGGSATLTPREVAARENARRAPRPAEARAEERGRPRRPSGSHQRDRRPGRSLPYGGGDVEGIDGGAIDGVRPAEGENLVALPERPRSVGERYPTAEGPQAEAAAKGVELLLRIAGLSLTPRIYRSEERMEIELVGTDTDWCFADDGELLMAIEHLLPRIIRSLSGEAVLCRVDCDNFHEIREERLRSLAQRVADEVRQRGRPRTLVPMNPADRRIVHVTLADDSGVVTESEGEGYFKRITIRPA
jgi:predicted RNA-binding protein Jag